MTAEAQKTLVSDIYRGKVVNLEPAIGAAFVDFGQGRNGFLHTSDVMSIYGEDGFTLDKLLTASVDPDDWEEDVPGKSRTSTIRTAKSRPRARSNKVRRARPQGEQAQVHSGARASVLPISDLLRVGVGRYVVVQVTKDAIGDKGPTLTTYISIPGRYLVLMPSMARTGVSRKIPDDKERRRLKRILHVDSKIPDQHGRDRAHSREWGADQDRPVVGTSVTYSACGRPSVKRLKSAVAARSRSIKSRTWPRAPCATSSAPRTETVDRG